MLAEEADDVLMMNLDNATPQRAAEGFRPTSATPANAAIAARAGLPPFAGMGCGPPSVSGLTDMSTPDELRRQQASADELLSALGGLADDDASLLGVSQKVRKSVSQSVSQPVGH